MIYLADFARPLGSKDKKKRERKPNKLIADARTLADKAIYGGGTGFLAVSALPFRSLLVERALKSEKMNRLGSFGKGLRNMAIDNVPDKFVKTAKGTKRVGARLAENLAAQTGGGLLGLGAGLGYGAYKVYKNRKKNRYD